MERVFGTDSHTFKEFTGLSDSYLEKDQFFRYLLPIFKAAKADYEGGYLFDVRNIIHAEVFSDELEQAAHFLALGYKVAAAITAGVVLETTIKRICNQNAIEVKADKGQDIKTDVLITELKFKNVYNEAEAKQLRAWMGVRNDAAHGKRTNDEFDQREVSRMIEGVGDFVAKHMN